MTRSYKRLSLFFLLILPYSLFAQAHNGELYHALLADWMSAYDFRFQSLEGDTLADWTPSFQLDSTAFISIVLQYPKIEYKRIQPKLYERKISCMLTQLQDSSQFASLLEFSDTLSLEEIRLIRKQSPNRLQGENPSRMSRIGKPSLIISASIIGILSLFYGRSRRR